jgi:hypothetical protein
MSRINTKTPAKRVKISVHLRLSLVNMNFETLS